MLHIYFYFVWWEGILGAKVLHLLVALPNVLAHLNMMNAYPNLWIDYFLNGFVFYGGVIGGFVCIMVLQKYHIYFWRALRFICAYFTVFSYLWSYRMLFSRVLLRHSGFMGIHVSS